MSQGPHDPGAQGPNDDAYTIDTRRRFKRRDGGLPARGAGGAAGAGAGAAATGGQGWDQGSPPAGGGYGPARSGNTSVMPAVPGGQQEQGYPGGGPVGPGGPEGPGGPGMPPARPRRRIRKRWVLGGIAALLVLWIAFLVWVPFNAWNNVKREAYAPSGQRPTPGKGKNYLLVGSDSREGLSEAQKKRFGATNAEGKRTDTIILVHVPEGDNKPVMISLPRDSWVTVPGHRKHKINAAYAIGGAKLLTATVEQNTGLHVDGYLEIGFGGFSNIVDTVGTVTLCPKFPMKDPEAGINLKPGCQEMDGGKALGYVRSRKTDPRGDIGRAERQREFLSAVMKKVASPGTVINPFTYKSTADAVAGGLTAGEDTSMGDAWSIMQAMRSVSGGQGISMVVPNNPDFWTDTGESAVQWDPEESKALFAALRNDQPVSK